jgi:hypothetical protein
VPNVNFVEEAEPSEPGHRLVNGDGAIRLRNGSPGTIQLTADISGYYLG